MARKVADCRRFPSESNCSLTLIGEEGEVLEEARAHAIRVHGHDDSAELRSMLRAVLEDEEDFERRTSSTPGRYAEPMYVG